MTSFLRNTVCRVSSFVY